MGTKIVTLDELLDATQATSDITDKQVFSMLIDFFDFDDQEEPIQDEIVKNLLAFRPDVVEMVKMEVLLMDVQELGETKGVLQ